MDNQTVKIEFLCNVTVQDKTGRHFAKGHVVELSQDSARHWLKRNMARIVNASVAPHVEEEVEAEAEPEEVAEEKVNLRGRKRKG